MALLSKIAGAIIGEKVAGRYGRGASGALIGAGVATVARRGLGPLGALLAAGYAAKKFIDWRRSKRARAYPADAPVLPVSSAVPSAASSAASSK